MLTHFKLSLLACCTMAYLGSAGVVHALDLHVAPDGNDAWSGKLSRPAGTNGPLATLTGARNAIRQLKKQGPLTEPIRVLVANGNYSITRPLELLPEDSGTEQAPISYEAAPGAHPVIDGGRTIGGWQRSENGLWQTHVPEVASGHWYFEQLWVNDRRAVRARTPNQDYFYMLDLFEKDLKTNSAAPGKTAQQTVWMRSADFQVLTNLTPAELKDVNLVVYHKWDVTRRFIDRVDGSEQALVTSGERMKPWNPWQRNSRFTLENFRGALDAPGEWFLSRDGALTYFPRPYDQMAQAKVIAPAADRFVVIAGDPTQGHFVEHITFKGLAFRHAQWLMPPGGFEPAQAAATIDAVVMADGARHVSFEDCEIGHIGTYAIWFHRGCMDDAVRHCNLHDFGAGGVRIGETSIAKDELERTGRITVDNNIIHRGGRIFPCAVGVWVGQSAANQITHNDVGDFFYTGISLGWTWGYGDSLANSNTIAFNRIHHLGQCVLSDMGGIYTLGRSEGTVVTNNFIGKVDSYSYGGWGLYPDEGSSGILFENNFVCGTKTGGFHQHYGQENIVRNNLFTLGWQQQLQATRVEPHRSFTFENNIVYYEHGDLFSGAWDKVQSLTRSNCYWHAPDGIVSFGGKTLAEWQAAGHDQGSIVADPHFVDPESFDFRLYRDSPAVSRIGFKPFDYTKAGVYGDEAWVQKAKYAYYPPVRVPPPPPPEVIRETFERYPIGTSPSGVELHVENHGDSIVVSDATAATGHQSLKSTDAPGLEHVYDPHLDYQVHYTEGMVRNSFDLQIEPGAVIDFEWRDWSNPTYYTGPQFTIRDGNLRLADAKMLELPVSQWVHFDIKAGLGRDSSGKWSLAVTVPGKAPQEFREQPFHDERFQKLTWVGLVSMATNTTSFYLDNFELETN